VTAVLVLVLAAVILFAAATRNPPTGAFYEPPPTLPAESGEIIRSEPFTAGVPDGARAWRVLYASTDAQDTPIAVSALIVAPRTPPPGPSPVLAWSHGTTGVVPPCAPSLSADPFAGIPDMSGALT
jgi:hypothetical protein